MCVRCTLLQLKISCVWLLGLNHWVKASVQWYPMIWLYQFWLFTVSIASSGNRCGLKPPRKWSHFYRVMPNICIIYRMRNDCLCWLFQATVDIIRDWFPQVPFCTSIELGRCTVPSALFSQPYGKKRLFGVLLMVSRVNAYSEWTWCTWTLITYHMYLFWARHHTVYWLEVQEFRHDGDVFVLSILWYSFPFPWLLSCPVLHPHGSIMVGTFQRGAGGGRMIHHKAIISGWNISWHTGNIGKRDEQIPILFWVWSFCLFLSGYDCILQQISNSLLFFWLIRYSSLCFSLGYKVFDPL